MTIISTTLSTIVAIENLPDVARGLIHQWEPGIPICLYGPVGVGKTTLAREIIREMCQAPWVPSPSFPIMIPYTTLGDETLWHMDLYRLTASADVVPLDIPNLISSHFSIIEWPQIMGALLRHHISVIMDFTDRENVRSINIKNSIL